MNLFGSKQNERVYIILRHINFPKQPWETFCKHVNIFKMCFFIYTVDREGESMREERDERENWHVTHMPGT